MVLPSKTCILTIFLTVWWCSKILIFTSQKDLSLCASAQKEFHPPPFLAALNATFCLCAINEKKKKHLKGDLEFATAIPHHYLKQTTS